jgi:hypothetical protein
LERREQEVLAAGNDERKRKKLEDEFTPRLEMTLVALEGKLFRETKIDVRYRLGTDFEYVNTLTVRLHTEALIDSPEMGLCARSNKTVPTTCLRQCQVSGMLVLQHLLVASEISSRLALPEYAVQCSYSGKRVLRDEAEASSVSGRLVASSFLRTSVLSGKRAEPEYFGRCEFTNDEVLNNELATSEISGKKYRIDQQVRSTVSGKTGHSQEFIACYETRQPLTLSEAEQCEVTGKYVRPGILERCAITNKRVLRSELMQCAVTGKLALKKLFVTSSISAVNILEEAAIRSSTGKFCTPSESTLCIWSGRKIHPEDLRICELTGLSVFFEYSNVGNGARLQPLVDLLNGMKRTADEPSLWDSISTKVGAALNKGRCRIESAILSPSKQHLAVCTEVRTLLGLRVQHIGFLYDLHDRSIIGHIVIGKRNSQGWAQVRN